MYLKIAGLLLICYLFFACNQANHDSDKKQSGVLEVLPSTLENGAIRHTVMFNLKSDSASDETKKFLQDGQRILSALPMVKNFEVLRQVSKKNDYQFYFSMVFDDQSAYDSYNQHPEHVKFVKDRWDKEVTDFLEADFLEVE